MNININILVQCVFLGLVFSFILIRPAYAYIDPGVGSMILQGIIAAVMAVALFVKVFWQKVLMFLGIKKNNDLESVEKPLQNPANK